MKKILIGIIGVLAACALMFFGIKRMNPVKDTASNTVTIYNWGDYVDPDLLKKFEKESGYHVIYETFDSNEAMFTKIKQGGTNYDLTIPSDYMIEKLRKANLLEKIDSSKIKGMNGIDPLFLHRSFDPKNQYSIPYFWGTLGIVYNDQKVKPGSITKWDDLWNPQLKNQILLVDSARDIMGLSLVSLGKSMNSTNNIDLKLAQTKLEEMSPNVRAIVADEMKMYMIQGEAGVGVTWSGEASEMLDQNSHLHYVVPTEGSNLWFDNMVIPKTVKNKKGAYAFINFMLEPKNAAQNAKYIGYSTPVSAAKKYLPKSVSSDVQFYPDAQTMKHLEVYRDLGISTIQKYNDLFLEFKMATR